MSQPMRKPKQLSSQCLPYDIIFDILTRLPVKSIIRFSFVSKSWNSILTSPDFINTHLDRAKSSLSHNNNNNNGFLLYIHKSYYKHLCTVLCSSDHTFTEISKLKIPFSDISVVDFCNGMFCLKNFENHELYLWNPSIRKFKILTPHYFARLVAYGLGFHSQNKDFKILRILCDNKMSEAEIYTLSTDSWRRVVISMESEPNIGSINLIDTSPCLFFKGALHSIAFSWNHRFILSFDVNAETFRQIMVPRNYFNENISLNFESLVVFKGSLAVFVCVEDLDGDGDICYLWVMREYGVVESWTKISVPIDFVQKLFGCTDNGELLINTTNRGLVSYDPESLNENYLGIQSSPWLSYTAGLIESLVLLDQGQDQGQGQVQDPNILLPTWLVPMYHPDGNVAEIPISRCTNVMRYPTCQATCEDLEEMIVMVESLKLEVTRLSRDLYVAPQEGAYDTWDSEATTLVSSSMRRREH